MTRTHIADWDDGQYQVRWHFGGNNSAKTKIKLAMLKEYLLGKNNLKAHKKEVNFYIAHNYRLTLCQHGSD